MPVKVQPTAPDGRTSLPPQSESRALYDAKGAARPARKVPYLTRRSNGVYLFVRRYPTEYVKRGVFRQPAYRKSLQTRDRLTAEKASRRLAARFDIVMDFLTKRDRRQGRDARAAAPRDAREVLGDDVAVIAQRFEALLLHSDELDRDGGMTHDELDRYIELIETQRSQVRDIHRRGDYAAFAEEVAGFLASEGLVCAQDSETWQQLLKHMAQAQLRALRSMSQRLDGDQPVPTPEAHPPVRAEEDIDDIDRAFAHWVTKTRPATKTIIEARSICERLKTLSGKTRISALSRAEMLSLQADEGKRKVRGGNIRPQTVNKLMGLVKAIFSLACDDLLTSRGIANPLRDMRKTKVKSADIIDKQDLSDEQLAALFSGPVHKRGRRPLGGAGEAAYWMPVLGHGTGGRMCELGQLSVHEVVVRDGVVCLWLTNGAPEGVPVEQLSAEEREKLLKRSLKTGESRRLIPVHKAVLALGFMDYVEHLRESGATALFPELRPDCHGNLTGNFSKWYNRYLRTVKIKMRGLDWISFRHTLKTHAREMKMADDMADYLEGHAAKRSAQKYGGFPPKTLQAALDGLSLPALSLVPKWRVPV